jgi:hypothetical protein
MCLDSINLLIAMIYSIWGMLSMESKTIACSFFGKLALIVISAKDFLLVTYFSGSMLMF